MKRARSIVVAAALLACAAGARAGATVELENAWVRPADGGQKATPLYVDVTSSAPLALVGASSDIAKSARLMKTDTIDGRELAKPVRSLDLARGKSRLAPRGSFVELRDVQRIVHAGVQVPFTLEFSDSDGRKMTASGMAVVRGLMPRPDEYETAPEK